ncbi:hypothetical protein [Streptomyces sp. NPDC056387]|uniref:hypothetical protein n=1 Tax=Streptomyces sp. NPDC056387 TaxID=3345803 RepID=UPI0035D6F09F
MSAPALVPSIVDLARAAVEDAKQVSPSDQAALIVSQARLTATVEMLLARYEGWIS